jgi:hypothetical protein
MKVRTLDEGAQIVVEEETRTAHSDREVHGHSGDRAHQVDDQMHHICTGIAPAQSRSGSGLEG